MSVVEQSADSPAWYAQDPEAALARACRSIPSQGLDAAEVQRRLAEYGPNQLATEPPPSLWSVALGQLSNPMNIMLAIVAVASLAIGQVATGIFVALLVTFNVVMGSRQELKARASVDALAQLQVPHARVRRAGQRGGRRVGRPRPGRHRARWRRATSCLPTAASSRRRRSRCRRPRSPARARRSRRTPTTLPEGDVALGDRTNMVFQNTQVTQRDGELRRDRQPVRRRRWAASPTWSPRPSECGHRCSVELDGMTKIFGLLAWTAVAIIAIVGIARGQDTETLILLCISTAISAIPVGLPTFVQTMLSSGARHLAEDKAVVKSLTDVETLGGTTVINSDKTGTLTMNAMTATTMLADGQWFRIEGGGYTKTGAILGVGGRTGAGLLAPRARAWCSRATRRSATTGRSSVIPTEAAFVVLAAKMGVECRGDPCRRCRDGRRCRSTPTTSSWRRSTIVLTGSSGGVLQAPHFMTVKGAPDVVIDRCSHALWHGEQVPIADVRAELLAANQEMSEQGLAGPVLRGARSRRRGDGGREHGPDGRGHRSVLVALVGIIDPLRAEAKARGAGLALDAGIDVRMITGDHTVTARAIADQLELGPGLITGTDLQQLSDAEVIERLPQLHVFGRVAPEDKVRLARLMQEAGEVVAMTGDAVNDAAALKQADIGVAMGSGSEVSKQAAKIVLTDDNFATLVRAVDLGRDIYRRITSYVKLQLTVLSSVLQLMVLATIFNINGGVALFPMQLLFCKFFVVVTVVVGFIADVPDPSVMQRPPRPPGTRIVTRPQVIRWLVSGFVIAGLALAVLQWGPDTPSTTHPSISMTMAFAIVALERDEPRCRAATRT